jgi:hypothetical protein
LNTDRELTAFVRFIGLLDIGTAAHNPHRPTTPTLTILPPRFPEDPNGVCREVGIAALTSFERRSQPFR